ncbi:alpha/beta hydrolase [Tardiphaga sp. 285_C5_N1_2]|uniref:alpha/beta hydrolase n=1 Tax=Tardiphaga sp. 285_C5_N1_2 TaxID=3240775 RepID=UPI003F8C84B1
MTTIEVVGSAEAPLHANVLFLHGLGGHQRETWSIKGKDNTFWPFWLHKELSDHSIFSVGYEAGVSRWRGRAMDLPGRANGILNRFIADQRLKRGRIIFIGHSLGGLVIKQFLRIASEEASSRPEVRDFLERIEKVAFIATPHSGADLASWADKLRIFVRPSAATSCLARNDPNLRDLNHWYRNWSRERGIQHLVLYESMPTSIFGMVVKPDNADPGVEGRPSEVNGDHWTICRPPDREHDTYVLVKDFIQRRSNTGSVQPFDSEKLSNAVVEKLMAALDQRGELAAAESAGIERNVVLKLAQKINSSVTSFDQALRELERAVDTVVAAVANEAQQSKSNDQQVDAALVAIAEKSAVGDFDAAAQVATTALDEWLCAQEEKRKSVLPNALQLIEAGLRQDILRRDEMSAAHRILKRMELEHGESRLERFSELRARQDEWYERGVDKGLNFDLLVSVELARFAIDAASSTNEKVDAMNDLGMALLALGHREVNSERLKESIRIYDEALSICPQASYPKGWGTTQMNKGNTLCELGVRRGSVPLLELAVHAYRQSLQEWRRTESPEVWGKIHSNLGSALFELGSFSIGIAQFEEAIDAYAHSQEVRGPEEFPVGWAITQNNLGKALMVLGERRESSQELKEAVQKFEAALAKLSRDSDPVRWAIIEGNRSEALRVWGELEGDPQILSKALVASENALAELQGDRAPLHRAECRVGLADVKRALGELTRDAALLRDAAEICRETESEFIRAEGPRNWSHCQSVGGNATRSLGEIEKDESALAVALKCCSASLEELSRFKYPADWTLAQYNLGRALLALGKEHMNLFLIAEAVSALQAAWDGMGRDFYPLTQKKAEILLMVANEMLGDPNGVTPRGRRALTLGN